MAEGAEAAPGGTLSKETTKPCWSSGPSRASPMYACISSPPFVDSSGLSAGGAAVGTVYGGGGRPELVTVVASAAGEGAKRGGNGG